MTTAYVEQLYTGCLAQAAYFVLSGTEAAVIDPMRDPAPYLELAKRHNATIKYVIETHFHADFVSGHVDLAKATGATIVYGPKAEPAFDAFIAKDGEELPLGDHKFTALHTPGHTMESTTFLLHKSDGAPHAIFTGDTLFIGDAGRPDLAQKAASMTQEQLAALLFTSLRTKIMPLPDDVVVFPGHGAGSACGKNMSSETQDTLGRQKLTNYTLRADATQEEFIKELLDGLRAPPQYFGSQVAINKGHAAVDETYADIIEGGKKKLSVEEFKAHLDAGKLVLDVRRTPDQFVSGFIPGTVFAGLTGSIAVWAATVLGNVEQPYALVADDDSLHEGLSRLARVGFNHCVGHLDGGVDAWKAAGYTLDTIVSEPASEVLKGLEAGEVQIIDVRGPGEYRNSHIDGATHAPLCSRDPLDFKSIVQPDKRAFAHCAGGYRSVMFLSLCKRAGVTAGNITGGYAKMMEVPAFKARAVERE
eukprot:CAMPEP_0174828346 /NCGR_PEP_ID=MMETSP1114-20130205/1275_1 /TAXON_ID=312471 /ORGANISM="Neobodo designis, Strain CCAP 1951/1" /LENGTH=474 /DNA_ID=CAMNT_0016062059 /DNA_START=52 /DNA_END=1476 /DNA_ORIENTATION=-